MRADTFKDTTLQLTGGPRRARLCWDHWGHGMVLLRQHRGGYAGERLSLADVAITNLALVSE